MFVIATFVAHLKRASFNNYKEVKKEKKNKRKKSFPNLII